MPSIAPEPAADAAAGTEPLSPDDPRLDGWYHSIDLAPGITTRGVFDHRPVVGRYGLPESLAGMTALDVGTADGFFAFEMERRGAERVVALDVDRLADCDWLPRIRPDLPATAEGRSAWALHFEMAHAMLGSRVERRVCNVYDLSPETVGTFDVVFCGDVLLHLQSPLTALCNMRSVTTGMLVVETVIDPEIEAAFPDKPVVTFGVLDVEAAPGQENTYWCMSTRALHDMLVYAGFGRIEVMGAFAVPPDGLTVTSLRAYPGRGAVPRWAGATLAAATPPGPSGAGALPAPSVAAAAQAAAAQAADLLEAAPAAPWSEPSRFGPAGRLARAALRRTLRPYISRRAEVDRAVAAALRALADPGSRGRTLDP